MGELVTTMYHDTQGKNLSQEKFNQLSTKEKKEIGRNLQLEGFSFCEAIEQGNFKSSGKFQTPKAMSCLFQDIKIIHANKNILDLFQNWKRGLVTIRETVRRLYEMSIMTQTGKEVWNPSTIHKMLKNPAYKGLAAYGKTKAGPVMLEVKPKKSNSRRTHSTYITDEENWIYIPAPQIVDEDLFNVVQKQLIENKQRARVQQRKETYLLQKLVVCKCCGRSYCGKRNYDKEKKILNTYYNCLGTRDFYGNKVCTNRSIRGEILETVVLEEVKSLLKEPERIINEYRRRLSEYENNGSQDETFEKQESKIKRCIANLIDGYAQESITKEEFEPRVKAMRQRLKAIEEEKEKMLDHKKLQQELNLAISSVKSFSAKIESNLDQLDWQAKRGIIKTLVKQIEINLDDVDIVWKIEELNNPTQERRNQNVQHRRRIHSTGMTLFFVFLPSKLQRSCSCGSSHWMAHRGNNSKSSASPINFLLFFYLAEEPFRLLLYTCTFLFFKRL